MSVRVPLGLLGQTEHVGISVKYAIPLGWIFFFKSEDKHERRIQEGKEDYYDEYYFKKDPKSAIELAESRLAKLEQEGEYFKAILKDVRRLVEVLKKVKGKKLVLRYGELGLSSSDDKKRRKTIESAPKKLERIINGKGVFFGLIKRNKLKELNSLLEDLGWGKYELTGDIKKPIKISERYKESRKKTIKFFEEMDKKQLGEGEAFQKAIQVREQEYEEDTQIFDQQYELETLMNGALSEEEQAGVLIMPDSKVDLRWKELMESL